jgi:hypothetical protein
MKRNYAGARAAGPRAAVDYTIALRADLSTPARYADDVVMQTRRNVRELGKLRAGLATGVVRRPGAALAVAQRTR